MGEKSHHLFCLNQQTQEHCAFAFTQSPAEIKVLIKNKVSEFVQNNIIYYRWHGITSLLGFDSVQNRSFTVV